MTPEEQRRKEVLQELVRRRRAAQLSHPAPVYGKEDRVRMGIADQLGIPLSAVDITKSIGARDRYDVGLLSDNPAEREAAVQRAYPGAKIVGAEGHLAVVPEGGVPIFVNPPGFDRGDVVEMAGRIGPATVGGTMGAFAGSAGGPFGTVAGGMAGVASAEGLRELRQRQAGTQRETLGDLFKRVGTDVAFEALPGVGPAFKSASKVVRNLGKSKAETFLADTLKSGTAEELQGAIKYLNDTYGVEMPPMMRYQRSDNPIIERLSTQLRQFSEADQQKVIQQMDQLAQSALVAGPKAAQSPDLLLQEGAAAAYLQEKNRLAGAPPNPQQAGEQLYRGVSSGVDRRKEAMTKAYQEGVAPLVQELNPYHDISAAREAAKKRTVPGLAPPEPNEMGGVDLAWIDAAEPKDILNRVDATIARLDDTQPYETVFELRRRVGNLLQMSDAELRESGVDIGRAKNAYRVLSDVMENPVNLQPKAKDRFVSVVADANAKAKQFHDTFRLGGVPDVLNLKSTQTFPSAYNKISSSPEAFNDAYRALLDEGDAEAVGEFKSALLRGIRQSDDPVAEIRRWEKENPEAYKWLLPNSRKQKEALETAKRLKYLNSGLGAEFFDKPFEEVGAARRVLEEDLGAMTAGRGSTRAAQARSLMRRATPEQKRAYRQVVYEQILEDAIEESSAGTMVLNGKTLGNAIKAAKKDGSWEGILTARDRAILDTATKYARKTYKKGDTGTALAIASQVGQIRQADPGAILNVFASRNLSRIFTSTDDVPVEWLFSTIGGNGLGGKEFNGVVSALSRAARLSLSTEEERRGQERPATLPPPLQATPPGIP
jgi:hypothetical protein